MKSTPVPVSGALPETSQPFNTVQPEAGGTPGWDRRDFNVLMTLRRDSEGSLYSEVADINLNGAIFGGQLIGQTVMAAAADMDEALQVHCLQLTFLSAGKPDQPICYAIQRLLSGRNFRMVQVQALQGERIVVNATVSFHRGETGPSFHQPMPAGIPDPESLLTMQEIMERNQHRLPEQTRKRYSNSRILDFRPVESEAFFFDVEPSASLRHWVKAKNSLPPGRYLHSAVLGYMSDYWFPLASLAPNLSRKIATGLYVASLNHTMWFHRPFKADDWLLICAQSPSSVQARGLTLGQVYNRAGELVATLAQEGLYRGWVESNGVLTAPNFA